MLRPTAMSISMIQEIAIAAKRKIRQLQWQRRIDRTNAEGLVAQYCEGIKKDAREKVQKAYSHLFIANKGGKFSAQKFYDSLGNLTARYFKGADADMNPLTCKLFRQAYTTIVENCSHRAGFLRPCAYSLNLEHQEQRQPMINPGEEYLQMGGGVPPPPLLLRRQLHQNPYHSIRSLLSVHALSQMQGGSNFDQEQLGFDVEEGAIRQTGHSRTVHHNAYGWNRHANPVLAVAGSRGLSVYELRQELKASLWFQREIIETTVSLDVLFQVKLFLSMDFCIILSTNNSIHISVTLNYLDSMQSIRSKT